MRLLLDSCMWGGARSEHEAAGHDVVAAANWEKDPSDQEILAQAFREGRILITLDKDFGELAIVRGSYHSGIVRLVNFSALRQTAVCLEVLRHQVGVGLEPDRSEPSKSRKGKVSRVDKRPSNGWHL